MDYNLLSIIKKEKENLTERKNDNYLRSGLYVFSDVKVEKLENGFDDCLPNSVLSNNQQETFNYDIKEEKQSCSICSENFINSYSLYKHNLVHLKVPLVRQKLFICDVCSNFYGTNKQLQNHITAAHEGKTLYNGTNSFNASLHKCEVCKKIFKYNSWLAHKNNVHQRPKLPCNKCNKLFKCTRYLKIHMLNIHEGIKILARPRVYQEGMTVQCPKCPKILNFKSSLMAHLRNNHSEGTFQCKICKSVFKSKPYLVGHMRRMHDDDGMLHNCDICRKSFKSPRKLRIHLKNSHTCQTGFQCPKCPKILNSKSSLMAHLRNNHSEGTFQCKICKSVFKSKPYLVGHMQSMHVDDGMLHHCDICRKSFKSPRKLRIHLKICHTCQKGIQCPKCPKILNCKRSLMAHLRNSHSEGTFHCDICGKSFKSPINVEIHKKNSLVQCPKCPKILNCKISLTAHVMSCHSEGMLQCKICKSVLMSKTSLLSHMQRVHYDDELLRHYGTKSLYF